MSRFSVMNALVTCVLYLTNFAFAFSAESELSDFFEHSVLPVLSKAGCNAGTCHGNANGKGGFFLSLRGQHPEFDYRQLAVAESGRRINPFSPEDSLLLIKATSQVAHEGGKRFADTSAEYQSIVDWIRSGLKPPSVDAPVVVDLSVEPPDAVIWLPQLEIQLKVVAHFSDGSSQDVSRMAVYDSSDPSIASCFEGRVEFAKAGSSTVNVRYLQGQVPVQLTCRSLPNEKSQEMDRSSLVASGWIDRLVHEKLIKLKIQPAPPASDSVFLRRLSLDLLGVLPTATEARRFVEDSSPEKRQQIIDHYLARPEFAAMWAQKWSDLLRNEEKTLDSNGVQLFYDWMTAQFGMDQAISEFARQMISSRGSTYENPPANYWRAHRDPLMRAETTAQVFLGLRLQCAKCHNHPFDHWSQDEYYQWASLFEGIDYEIVANDRKDNLDKHEFVGDQRVLVKSEGMVKNPRTGQPAQPRFLGDSQKIDGDRLEQLADWMTSPTNRQFAKAQVNRIWFHTMGVGLVDPIDDLRTTNPATHPELLERLADEFIASGYSLKHLVREIVSSATYQLDSKLDRSQLADGEQLAAGLMAQAVVRRLTAEQLLDAQSQILDVPQQFEGYPDGTRAIDIAGVERKRRSLSADDLTLRRFGKPERLLACECERSNEATLGQALSLVGGQQLNERLRQTDNRIGRLMAQGLSNPKIIDSLFWTALTRPATEDELGNLELALQQSEHPREIFEDIVWALLNSKELLFRN